MHLSAKSPRGISGNPVTVTPSGFAGSAVFNLYAHSMSEDRDYVDLSVFSLFDGGNNINACRVGGTFPVYAKCYKLVLEENDPDDENDDFWAIRPFEGRVTMDGHTAAALGDHIYKDDVPITEPGLWEVDIRAKEDDVIRARAYCEVYGVEFSLIDAANRPVDDTGRLYLPVDENGIVREDYPIRYRINPFEYAPGTSYVLINKGDTLIHYMVPAKTGTQDPYAFWQAVLSRGRTFDPEASYTVESVLNYGAEAPVRMTAGPVPLEIVQADIDADLYNTGQANEDDPDETMTGLFVLINNDDDNANSVRDADDTASGAEENDLVEAKLFSSIGSGKMALTASTSGPGRIKVWDSAAKTTLLIDLTDTDPANDTRQWDVTATLEKTVWIEGIAASGSHADIDLALTTQTSAGEVVATDLLTVTVCDISIVTDFNRDRVIDETDEEAGARGDVFYFWLNDDNDIELDFGDDAVDPIDLCGYDDVPGYPGASSEDRESIFVDNKRDLIDFFPVLITVKPGNILDLTNTNLTLQTEQGAVNIAYTKIPDGARAGNYLTDPDTAVSLRRARTYEVDTEEKYIITDKTFVDHLKDTGQGVLIAEGAEVMSFESDGSASQEKKAVVLQFNRGDNTIVASRLNLSINEVKMMFRHKNLIDATGENIKVEDRDSVSNFPDDPSCTKDFVFIHGYNVNEQQAQGWHAEFFKKLFWAGSRARFHAITWYGSDSQLPCIPGVGCRSRKYHSNVFHAFQTAPHLVAYLANKDLVPGSVILAAHSLGNMAACEAVRLAPDNVDKYFMLDAAVASEAIDPTQHEANMLHVGWIPYEGLTDLYASEWHRLFASDTGDLRKDLTWDSRFSSIAPKIINLYSSGDQVFESHPKNDEPSIFEGLFSLASGRFAFAFQEKRKGSDTFAGGDEYTFSNYAGWRFNYHKTSPEGWSKQIMGTDWYRMYTRQEVLDEIINADVSVLKTKPFFGMGERAFRNLFAEDTGTANVFLSQEELGASNIHRVIAGAIPAMSLAMGRTELVYGVDDEIDINRSLKPLFWPDRGGEPWERTNWLHNDIREMAYLYTNRVYTYLVEEGGLK